LVTADFNGDGLLDVAVANHGDPPTGDDGDVGILLGNGDGSFPPIRHFQAGKNPIAIVAADLNGDFREDLVAANLGDRPSGGPGDVSVLLGHGDGTFEPAVALVAGHMPFALAAGDFNGDLTTDIAVSEFGNRFEGDHGSVDLLFGNGNGELDAPVILAAGQNPVGVTARDFDGDGRLDLAVANQHNPASTSGGRLTILPGNGDGTFGAAVLFDIRAFPTSIGPGDLNRDGKPDLVVSSFFASFGLASGGLNILLDDGSASFSAHYVLLEKEGSTRATFPSSPTVEDFDGDGNQDVAEVLGRHVGVQRGNGDGTLQGHVISTFRGATFVGTLTFSAGTDAYALATGDFNGDGKPDIAVANKSSDDVSILVNVTGL
jgi:hypothetical protein